MDGNDFSFLLTYIRCNFLLETNLQRKSGRNGKKGFLSSFVKQRFCNGITMLSKFFRNGTEMVHLQWNAFETGTETVLVQRNDSLQRIDTGCETFQEKHFENYFATVLEWYSNSIATVSSVRNYIFVNDNFHFTEKQIPFCQETIIVSIRLQRLCNDLIRRSSLRQP
jgi:hypothetical protein